MSLLAKLVRFVREATGRPPDEEPSTAVDESYLAAAALLVHVARVDGRIADRERQALLGLLETRYGLDREGAEALVARADRFDLEVDDVGTLVEMLGHEGDDLDRTKLVAMAYRVAAAEGGIGEFEESMVWRLGRLLRLDDAAIGAIRAETLGPGVPVVEGTV